MLGFSTSLKTIITVSERFEVVIFLPILRCWATVQSTRKIARRLNTDSNPVSHMTIYRYLKNCIGASAFKRQKIPRLSAKNIQDRLNFANKHQSWKLEDWKRVRWSDESPFELYATANRHNDRVWAKTTKDVPPIFAVKFPLKIQVSTYVTSSTL